MSDIDLNELESNLQNAKKMKIKYDEMITILKDPIYRVAYIEHLKNNTRKTPRIINDYSNPEFVRSLLHSYTENSKIYEKMIEKLENKRNIIRGNSIIINGGNESIELNDWKKLTKAFKEILYSEKKLQREYELLNEEIMKENHGISRNNLIDLSVRVKILDDYKYKLDLCFRKKQRILEVIEIVKKIIDGKMVSMREISLRTRTLNSL